MTITLTEQEYAMLKQLCTKGLKAIEDGVKNYSDLNVPTYIRNKCADNIQAYRTFVSSL